MGPRFCIATLLTYMATIATLQQLVTVGALERVEVDLERHQFPERQLYALPPFLKWLDETLPEMNSTLNDDFQPIEQVEARLVQFVSGHPLGHTTDLRDLRPLEAGIWELKTPDTRIFGWFPLKDHFIAAYGDDASRVKDHNLYGGYRDSVVRLRDELQLDEPKFVTGRIDDVISL